MSKTVKFECCDIKNILDIMIEPKKLKIYPNGQIRYEDRYPLIEINGRRKTISKTDFLNLLQYYLKEE